MLKVRALVRSCDNALGCDGERSVEGKGRAYDFYPLPTSNNATTKMLSCEGKPIRHTLSDNCLPTDKSEGVRGKVG